MNFRAPIWRRGMLFLLYLVFALTAVADVMAGPLLLSQARSFHLSDSQAGLLFFWVFGGTATVAMLCRGNCARGSESASWSIMRLVPSCGRTG